MYFETIFHLKYQLQNTILGKYETISNSNTAQMWSFCGPLGHKMISCAQVFIDGKLSESIWHRCTSECPTYFYRKTALL